MIKFWKKDFINKLIVMTALMILAALGLIVYLLTSTAPGAELLARLYPTPTLSVKQLFEISGATATAKVVNATASVIPTWTTQPLTPVIKSPTPVYTRTSAQSVVNVLYTATPTATATFTLAPSPTATNLSAGTPAAPGAADACLPSGPVETGTVINVLSSSSVQVLLNDLVYTVRYLGLVSPSDPNVSQLATYANGDLVYGKKVTLISDGDNLTAGSSLLRYVVVDGTLANLEMLKQGHAELDPAASGLKCLAAFQAAEDEAKAVKRGMWK